MENEKETQPFYKCVKSSSGMGFVKELNKAHQNGYKPIWDTHQIYEDHDFNPILRKRFVIVYDQNALDITTEEIELREQISEDILEAEFYVAKSHDDYKEEEANIRLKTDWNVVQVELGVDKLLADDKKSYIEKQSRPAREWYNTCKNWLAHVKRLDKLHIRANSPPWENPALYTEQIGEEME